MRPAKIDNAPGVESDLSDSMIDTDGDINIKKLNSKVELDNVGKCKK